MKKRILPVSFDDSSFAVFPVRVPGRTGGSRHQFQASLAPEFHLTGIDLERIVERLTRPSLPPSLMHWLASREAIEIGHPAIPTPQIMRELKPLNRQRPSGAERWPRISKGRAVVHG